MPETITDLETAAPEIAETFGSVMEGFTLSKALYTALLLMACIVVVKVLLRLLERTILRLKVERSLHTFIRSTAKILLWFITILIVGDYIGLPVSALLGVLGVAGLALSLALQGTLSNLAGGIMVLISKPFAVGDFVEAGGLSGTVSDIGLVYTKLTTIDNKIIYVPNGEISGEKIVNYNGQTQRRVDLKFDISYDSDPEKAKQVIQEVVGAHPKVLFTPVPFARVSAYNESSVSVTVRVWCATEDYWDLYFDLLEQIRVSFDRNGIELTYNHLNVHIVDTGR